MSAQGELTPVQLAALDLMIASKQSASPSTANCWIDCIVNVVTATTPVVVATIAAASDKASSVSNGQSIAEAMEKAHNLTLDQLKAIRSQAQSK